MSQSHNVGGTNGGERQRSVLSPYLIVGGWGGEILMCRPNQSHPTFPILLDPNDVPWRALFAFALVEYQFLPCGSTIFNQLEVVGGTSFAKAYSHVPLLLGLAFEAKCATFGFESPDLGVDISV